MSKTPQVRLLPLQPRSQHCPSTKVSLSIRYSSSEPLKLPCDGNPRSILTLLLLWVPRKNFSTSNQYSIKQKSDENEENINLVIFLVDPIPNSPN